MSESLRVLFIEDSEDDTLLLLRELKRGGFDVVFERVDTAEAMLLALEKQVWDIVISDYVMPHFSGITALNLLRTSGIDLPFIMVSGKIGEDTAVEAMHAGAHDYIVKGRMARFIPAVKRGLSEASLRKKRKDAEEALRKIGIKGKPLEASMAGLTFKPPGKPTLAPVEDRRVGRADVSADAFDDLIVKS